MNWKDTTSYSQNEKDRVPRTWTAKINKADIMVHRHIHYEDIWLLSSRYLDLDKIELKNKEVDQAKIEALQRVKEILERKISEYGEIIDTIK